MIIEYLQSQLEFPSFEFLQQVTVIVMELYNNIRQWALKGHKPAALFQEERETLKPLPAVPFIMGKARLKAKLKRNRLINFFPQFVFVCFRPMF